MNRRYLASPLLVGVAASAPRPSGYEPVVTERRTWLDIRVENTETGQPVEGLEQTISVEVEKGGQRAGLELSGVWGKPGQYKAPIFFTEPGTYMVHIEGTIEGQSVHQHFEKEVVDMSSLNFPAKPEPATAAGPDPLIYGSFAIAIAAIALAGVSTARSRRPS